MLLFDPQNNEGVGIEKSELLDSPDQFNRMCLVKDREGMMRSGGRTKR